MAYHIHPNHIHVLNNLATSYAKLGDYESAVEYYKKALDVWPGFTEAQINLGVIYFHMGKFKEAQRCLLPCEKSNKDIRISTYLKLIEIKLKGNLRE
jgi:Flp pilus assembly protein TadD